MEIAQLWEQELKGSVDFFLNYTNRDPSSQGFGLTLDSTKDLHMASIAAVGFALTAWVIGDARGYISRPIALDLTRGTLNTLACHVTHHRGFFAHFLHIETGARMGLCEYSTIDTALCLNGVITAAAYFGEPDIDQMAQHLLDRVDWRYFVAEHNGRTVFRMAYNPDRHGDYVADQPGFIHQWDMAAEQKMLYFQAAGQLEPELAVRLYHGFARDTREFDGQKIIVNPDGNLFAYQYSQAWFDTRHYLDPDEIDWFNNTRLAALANRRFCIAHAAQYMTYHANSWGLSAGDSPNGYYVSGSEPCLRTPRHNGTVSIYAALASLPFIPAEVSALALYLYHQQPQTWGPYGFYDAYNLAVSPPWYSGALYGIDKGCSMIMIENHLTGLVWNTYTQSAGIQKALGVLGFRQHIGELSG